MTRRLFLILLIAVFVAVSIVTLRVTPLQAEETVEVMLPGGYRIEPVVTGLTFPTSVAWDGQGRMWGPARW